MYGSKYPAQNIVQRFQTTTYPSLMSDFCRHVGLLLTCVGLFSTCQPTYLFRTFVDMSACCKCFIYALPSHTHYYNLVNEPIKPLIKDLFYKTLDDIILFHYHRLIQNIFFFWLSFIALNMFSVSMVTNQFIAIVLKTIYLEINIVFYYEIKRVYI